MMSLRDCCAGSPHVVSPLVSISTLIFSRNFRSVFIEKETAYVSMSLCYLIGQHSVERPNPEGFVSLLSFYFFFFLFCSLGLRWGPLATPETARSREVVKRKRRRRRKKKSRCVQIDHGSSSDEIGRLAAQSRTQSSLREDGA